MIATHTAKLFNARIKTPGVAARLDGAVPPYFICSQNIKMRREFWAAPVNAAEMKYWREVIENLPKGYEPESLLPGITDPQLKQILIPLDWRNDDYLSTTPVISMGVIYELNKRIQEMKLPYQQWTVQPNPAARSNHGETLLRQGGIVRLLRRGVFKRFPEADGWQGDFVQMTARCERMNVSSGMMAVGFPAITAVGGFVHALERSVGCDIEFAAGARSIEWSYAAQKVQVHQGSYGTSTGRIKGSKAGLIPGYSTEEITATGEIVLLLRINGEQRLDELANHLRNCHRLAGGSLFDVEVSIVNNGCPPAASYLVDATVDPFYHRLLSDCDPLQASLEIYGMDGDWQDEKWKQPRNGYTLNHTGYALLESPTSREGSRNDYHHAWSEPVFSLITQGSCGHTGWWTRRSTSTNVIWRERETTAEQAA